MAQKQRTFDEISDLRTRKALKELARGGGTHTHDGSIGGSIDHIHLLNIGTNTHAVVDAHVASTANPHSVTAAQAVAPALVSPSVADNFVSFSNTAGLQKDSGSKTADFAVAAKGVTNGDSHDHVGGDGAQIDHTGLSNIGTNAHSVIDTHVASTSNPHSVTAAQAGAPALIDPSVVGNLVSFSSIAGAQADSGIATTDFLNRSVISGVVVSDEGGLNIAWTAGKLYSIVSQSMVAITAGSGACTDGAVNCLVWEGYPATTLVIRLAPATGNETNVAVISCQSVSVLDIHQDLYLNETAAAVKRSLNRLLPVIVTDGLIVSEDTDATNAFDVSCSAGIFYVMGVISQVEASPILSRTTPMRRWYHSGGAWTSNTNAEIDITQYDNGTNLTATSAPKYYKSLFMIMDGVIQWIYPQVEHDTEAQGIAGALPTIPPGLALHPLSTSVMMKGDDAAFPTAGGERWVDVRPLLCRSAASAISDHGALSGLTDDDHTQYVKHALATAASDFLAASGSGAFVKKTLAETKTLLGVPEGMQIIRKSADETVTSSTTLQSDDQLLFAMTTGGYEMWQFEFGVFHSMNPGQIKLAVLGPGVQTLLMAHFLCWNVEHNTSDYDSPLLVNVNYVGRMFTAIRGTIHNGGTAGDFVLRWAQRASNATPTTVYAGSYVKVWKI